MSKFREDQLKRLLDIERETVSLLLFIEMLDESESPQIRDAGRAILDRGPIRRLRKLLKEGADESA